MLLSYRSMVNMSERNLYTAKGAYRCVILVKHCSKEHKVVDSKLELFKLLSTIIVKNIENFFYLAKNYDHDKIFHSKEDLVGEAYLVLEQCLKNFDTRRGKQFYLYYNKALTRAFLRIIDRSYQKHSGTIRIKPEYESHVFQSPARPETADFTDFYLDAAGLTDEQQRVVKSKLNKQRIQEFLDDNPDITWNKYFKELGDAKVKLQPILHEIATA